MVEWEAVQSPGTWIPRIKMGEETVDLTLIGFSSAGKNQFLRLGFRGAGKNWPWELLLPKGSS